MSLDWNIYRSTKKAVEFEGVGIEHSVAKRKEQSDAGRVKKEGLRERRAEKGTRGGRNNTKAL